MYPSSTDVVLLWYRCWFTITTCYKFWFSSSRASFKESITVSRDPSISTPLPTTRRSLPSPSQEWRIPSCIGGDLSSFVTTERQHPLDVTFANQTAESGQCLQLANVCHGAFSCKILFRLHMECSIESAASKVTPFHINDTTFRKTIPRRQRTIAILIVYHVSSIFFLLDQKRQQPSSDTVAKHDNALIIFQLSTSSVANEIKTKFRGWDLLIRIRKYQDPPSSAFHYSRQQPRCIANPMSLRGHHKEQIRRSLGHKSIGSSQRTTLNFQWRWIPCMLRSSMSSISCSRFQDLMTCTTKDYISYNRVRLGDHSERG